MLINKNVLFEFYNFYLLYFIYLVNIILYVKCLMDPKIGGLGYLKYYS